MSNASPAPKAFLRSVSPVNDSQNPNIVLTGFMGTGKSAVGRQIAAETGRTFVDLDAEIVTEYGDIPAIFSEHGEQRFRKIEREMVAKFAPLRNQVIATGGGTLLDHENVVAFLGAEVFALSADAKTIRDRVLADGIEKRPLLAQSDDVTATIAALLEERSEAYGRFTQVDTTGKSVDEVVAALRDAGATLLPAETATPATSKKSADRILIGIVALCALLALVVLVLVLTF